MRMSVRFGAFTLAIVAAFAVGWLRSVAAADVVTIRPDVEVLGATPRQIAMARWAVGRFEAAGLRPPAVEIEFHSAPSGCGGHLGFARSGEVDVCSTLVNAMARRNLLHEMSHVWLDGHVDDATESRFLALRDLPSWNASSDPWRLRGCEQGAEILAWAFGDRILSAQIPDNDPSRMAEAYRLLTGERPPESRAMIG